MRSHFLTPGVAAACAVAGAAAVLNGNCCAAPLIAADYATNSIYGSGWSAGQNGGYGFGAWNFDGTTYGTNIMGTNVDLPDPGSQQEMGSSFAIGTAWTMFNLTSTNGISNVGRAITEPGGLQVGQTFQTVIENPSAYHFFRGFDILFYNVADNEPGGDNAAALRLSVFGYYLGGETAWSVTDNNGGTLTTLFSTNSAAAGLQIALTVTSTNTYALTMTPLNGSTPYTQAGPLALVGTVAYPDTNSMYWSNSIVTNLPINYVNYRLWNTASKGSNDSTNNFFISSMTILGVTLNIQLVGNNAILSWTTNFPSFYLASSSNLGPSAVWNTNLPASVVVNGQNVVTNPVAGTQQYFRLQ
ncbi:MAG: hypothetical protein WBS33_19270 [Verrucomicrobiia bacterium]